MKNLFYASLAVVVLASCQKESTVDSSITMAGQEITYAPYASASVTKGSAVDSNADFQGESGSYNSFKVAAYSGTETYFGFRSTTYDGSAWSNDVSMYWPNADADLHFGAYYPASATFSTAASYSHDGTDHSLTFGYTVIGTVAEQVDLMYALTDHTYTAPAGDELTNDADEESVALHFKHALTQVGFTATKSDDIAVYVESIKICNVVDNGTFTATTATTVATVTDVDPNNGAQDAASVETDDMGSWTPSDAAAQNSEGTVTTNLQNYTATMVDFTEGTTSVTVAAGTTATPLTSTTDVMMLLPQTLEAWDPTVAANNDGTESYLAIKCKITHSDGTAAIVDGTIYVPFSTEGITYSEGNTGNNTWQPGYKLTYNLVFGGGYTIPEGDDDDDDPDDPDYPEPGETPDPEDVVPTLRDITYTVTVDEWIPVAASTDLLTGDNTTDSDSSDVDA